MSSSKYTLGFRIDPEDRLRSVGKELSQLLKAHQSQPELGVFDQPAKPVSLPLTFDEDVVVEQNQASDSARLYRLEQANQKSAEPVYDEELGLLVEKMAENVSLDKLFCVWKRVLYFLFFYSCSVDVIFDYLILLTFLIKYYVRMFKWCPVYCHHQEEEDKHHQLLNHKRPQVSHNQPVTALKVQQ